MKRWLSALAIALALCAQPLTAAVTLVAHANWQTTTSGSFDSTAGGGGNLIVVCYSNLFNVGTVTDNQGNPYTKLNEITSGVRAMAGFYTIAPTTSASHTVTLGSPSVSGAVVGVFHITSPVFDNQNTGNTSAGTTVTTGSPFTPGAASNLLTTCLGGDGNTSFAIDTGFTIADTSPYFPGTDFSASLAYLEQATASQQTATWTVGANASVILAHLASFTFTGGGGGGGSSAPPCLLRLLGVGCNVP